jgi:hypothetical protein
MSHPLVAHHKKKPFDIFIARPSMWGNPFEIGRDGSRSEVIQKFADWIHRQPELMVAIPSLHGKVLWAAGARRGHAMGTFWRAWLILN